MLDDPSVWRQPQEHMLDPARPAWHIEDLQLGELRRRAVLADRLTTFRSSVGGPHDKEPESP